MQPHRTAIASPIGSSLGALCLGAAAITSLWSAPAAAQGYADRERASAAVMDPAQVAVEVGRFRTGRNLATAGGYVSLAGSGLGLAGFLTTAINPSSEVGTGLTYAGTGLGVLGFGLEAGGVGMQHTAAENLGRDPGRGLYVGGTTLGVLGIASLGAGIFFGSTSIFDSNNQFNGSPYFSTRDVVVLSCLGGSFVLSTVSHILYSFDQRRLAQAMSGLYAF